MNREQMARLPQYARQEIERLRRDLADARERLGVGPEGSNTFAEPYSDTPRPLGTDTTVQFTTRDGTKFRVRVEGDTLDVNADSYVAIEPRASNDFRVGARRP